MAEIFKAVIIFPVVSREIAGSGWQAWSEGWIDIWLTIFTKNTVKRKERKHLCSLVSFKKAFVSVMLYSALICSLFVCSLLSLSPPPFPSFSEFIYFLGAFQASVTQLNFPTSLHHPLPALLTPSSFSLCNAVAVVTQARPTLHEWYSF